MTASPGEPDNPELVRLNVMSSQLGPSVPENIDGGVTTVPKKLLELRNRIPDS